MLPDTGHCAVSKLPEVLDLTVGWLPKQLGLAPPATTRREVDAALATPLPVASPASVGFSPERLNRIDGAMQAEIDAGHYAGISVMVARHGKLVKSGATAISRLKAVSRCGKTPSSASPR